MVKKDIHLAYANDLLIFCKAKKNCFEGVKKLLEEFTLASGLEVSERKSETFFSGATKNKQELLNIVPFTQGKFPVRYLGLPLSPRILYKKDCL